MMTETTGTEIRTRSGHLTTQEAQDAKARVAELVAKRIQDDPVGFHDLVSRWENRGLRLVCWLYDEEEYEGLEVTVWFSTSWEQTENHERAEVEVNDGVYDGEVCVEFRDDHGLRTAYLDEEGE